LFHLAKKFTVVVQDGTLLGQERDAKVGHLELSENGEAGDLNFLFSDLTSYWQALAEVGRLAILLDW
jgi:hypothetical protein